jgi:predicted dehydrogenase
MGLLGCGRIAQQAHLKALRKADGIELVGVCDTRRWLAEAVAQRYGVEHVFDQPDELLQAAFVDAVLITVPDPLHVDLAIRALDAGKHVLVEKPLAPSSKECQQVAEAVERTGCKLQVGNMRRYDPGMQFARAFVREHLGRIISFSAWYRVSAYRSEFEATLFPPRLDADDADPIQVTHKADRKRYLLMTHGAHLFDSLRYLVGEPSELVAQFNGDGGIHSWHGLLRLKEGGQGQFELTVPVQSDWAEGFNIYGETGSVAIRSFFPFFLRASEAHCFSSMTRTSLTPLSGDSDPYERQLEAFSRAINEDRPTTPDVGDGLAAVELIERVTTAANTGERLHWP